MPQIYPLVHKSFEEFTKYLFKPTDVRGLAMFRILFGTCMFLDIFQERGLDDADIRFGNSNHCFFPLFSFMKPPTVQVACVFYSVMWIGSLGILFGYKFRTSCFLFLTPYVYFLLLDKSRWNNHSYLFALIVILMAGSNASASMSLDNFLQEKSTCEKHASKNPCPSWNYFMLKFQFTLLYVMAAVKKMDPDWLAGYSMRNVAKHRILSPMSGIIGEEVLAYYFIHLGGFAFDLFAGLLLNFKKTLPVGVLFSVLFHGLNSQLFEIGMFPYVCLSSLTLFSSPEIFQPLLRSPKASKNLKAKQNRTQLRPSHSATYQKTLNGKLSPNLTPRETRKRSWITLILVGYMSLQVTLPFTHSLTKGYNNWTEGLYGYSWDMMVYSWDTLHTKITVKDYVTGTERFLDPNVWTTNERWSSHADMAKQYADCIARNLSPFNVTTIQVYFDVWKSLNGRFQQRIFDPTVDILKAPWSPWERVPWVLPLLEEFSHWRTTIFEGVTKQVADWSKSSNVIFVADYPGLTLENYLPRHLNNVSVVIMKGEIVVEQRQMNVTLKTDETHYMFSESVSKHRVSILPNSFHKIHTVSSIPACYMYTYTNKTQDDEDEQMGKHVPETDAVPRCVHIIQFLQTKWSAFARSFYLVVNSYLKILFDVPMVLRKSVD